MQDEIQRAAYRFQMEIESGERPVVGVNVHADTEASLPRTGGPDYSALERHQVERLMELRRGRDAAQVARALATIGATARGDANLVPPLIDAVKARVTLGEISDALRAEWGTFDG
jgi:methylmalonyl-CoA mutase N-terminal domain/subunit